MPQTNGKQSAWVITWDWVSETRKPHSLLLYILPAPWSQSRVLQHMKYLYINSELFRPSRRVPLLPERDWKGLLFEEGPRIIIGDDPFLIGSYVHDLRFESVEATTQIVRWTQPAGLRPKSGSSTEPETIGNAVERALEVGAHGEIRKTL
jgi:hypothetical protein